MVRVVLVVRVGCGALSLRGPPTLLTAPRSLYSRRRRRLAFTWRRTRCIRGGHLLRTRISSDLSLGRDIAPRLLSTTCGGDSCSHLKL